MLKIVKYLFLSIVLLTGCEQKHFSHIYENSLQGSKLRDLRVEFKDKEISKFLKKSLKDHNIKIDPKSHYKLISEYRLYGHRCNNPLATQEQKSYIGFVQIILYKDKKEIYMCESDFRDKDEIEDIVDGLIDIMIDEMKFKM